MRSDSREDTGHHSALETKSCTIEGKWDSTAPQMVERFKETCHPVIKSISALSRGILKRKNDRDTTHSNADASNTELLFRTIHLANQLRVYGAVKAGVTSSVKGRMEKEPTSEQFVEKENEQLLKSETARSKFFGANSKSDDPASGIRLREYLQHFETLENSIHFTKVCEDPSFWKRVSFGMCYKNCADVAACREYTHPRADIDSRIYSAIPGRTRIEPVLQVHMIQFFGTRGTKLKFHPRQRQIEIPWAVICREKNRYVDELHRQEPAHFPKESDLCSSKWSQHGASKKLMRSSSKIRRIQCATQKKLLFVGEKKWFDIPACQNFRGHTFEDEFSKLVMRFGTSL